MTGRTNYARSKALFSRGLLSRSDRACVRACTRNTLLIRSRPSALICRTVASHLAQFQCEINYREERRPRSVVSRLGLRNDGVIEKERERETVDEGVRSMLYTVVSCIRRLRRIKTESRVYSVFPKRYRFYRKEKRKYQYDRIFANITRYSRYSER